MESEIELPTEPLEELDAPLTKEQARRRGNQRLQSHLRFARKQQKKATNNRSRKPKITKENAEQTREILSKIEDFAENKTNIIDSTLKTDV